MEWGQIFDQIIIGHKDGTIKLYNTLANKYAESISTSSNTAIVGVGYINRTLVAGSIDGFIHLWQKRKLSNFSLNLDDKSTLECMACNKNRQNIIGTGGESNDLKLWDVETRKCIFKAKSVSAVFSNDVIVIYCNFS